MKPGGTSWRTGKEIANARTLMCTDCSTLRPDVHRVHVRARPGYRVTEFVPLCDNCIRKRRPATVRSPSVDHGETVKASDGA